MKYSLYLSKIATRIKWKLNINRILLDSKISKLQSEDYIPENNLKIENRKLKILFFSHNFLIEGSPLSLFELVSTLKKNYQLDITVISFKDGELKDLYLEKNIKCITFENKIENIFSEELLNNVVYDLKEIIQNINPDKIFVNTMMAFPAIISARELGIRTILNVREGEDYRNIYKHFPFQIAHKALASVTQTEKVIFVSNYSFEKWKLFNKNDRFLVIRNKINPLRFNNLVSNKEKNDKSKEIILLSIGTFCKRKGQFKLIKAIDRIKNKIDKNIKIIFVGDFNNSYGGKTIKKATKISRIYQNIKIEFHECNISIQDYYKKADLFMHTSTEESCSRTLLEAMYFNLHIISSDIGANQELIGCYPKTTFFKLNSVDQLSYKIIDFLDSFISSDNNRLDNRNYDNEFKNMVDKYYNQIISN